MKNRYRIPVFQNNFDMTRTTCYYECNLNVNKIIFWFCLYSQTTSTSIKYMYNILNTIQLLNSVIFTNLYFIYHSKICQIGHDLLVTNMSFSFISSNGKMWPCCIECCVKWLEIDEIKWVFRGWRIFMKIIT